MDKSKKIKYLSTAIKILVVLLSFAFIYNHVIVEWSEKESLNPLDDISLSPFLFSAVVLLLFFNWGFEALKWKFLASKVERISYWESYKGVLSGVTISIFAPFKMGEYIGRSLHLNPDNRISASVLSVYGSMVQLFITVLLGGLSLIYFLWKFSLLDFQWIILISISLLIANALLFLSLIFPSILLKVLNKTPLPEKWKKYFNVLAEFEIGDLIVWAILVSMARYFVFSLQFYICLLIFNVDLPLIDGLVIVAISFYALSFLSLSALMELGATRTAITLFLLETYMKSTGELIPAAASGVWMASTIIWLINLAFPAIIGAIFMYRVKIFKEE